MLVSINREDFILFHDNRCCQCSRTHLQLLRVLHEIHHIPTCPPPAYSIITLSCFKLTARLPLPTGCQTQPPSCTPGLYLWPFPSVIHFTLKEGERSFKTLVSYHNATWHHNPEDFNLNLQCHETSNVSYSKTDLTMKRPFMQNL
jgi:hypothetical protein